MERKEYLKEVELIPQNMAPFPWHFGGQRYQNLFVFPEEIIDWCKKLDLRIEDALKTKVSISALMVFFLFLRTLLNQSIIFF